jgi:tetratricopeptide (TPR) repeat protein
MRIQTPLIPLLLLLAAVAARAQAPDVGPVQCSTGGGAWGSCGSSSSGGGGGVVGRSSTPPPPPSPAEQAFSHGVDLERDGDYAEAEQAFRLAVELDPKYGAAHHGIAYTLDKQGDYEGALMELELALQYGVKRSERKADEAWLRQLRDWNERKNNVALATQAFNEGARFYDQQRYAEAEAAYRKAFAYDPDAPTATNIALSIQAQNRLQEAEEFFRKAIALDSGYVEARRLLSTLLIKEDKFGEAENELRRVMQLGGRPVDEESLGLCLATEAEAGGTGGSESAAQNAEAEQLLRHALVSFPNSTFVRESLAIALNFKSTLLESQGNFTAAEEAARDAISWNPKSVDAHNQLGELLLLQKHNTEADAEFQQSLKLDPGNAAAQQYHFRATQTLGWANALAEMEAGAEHPASAATPANSGTAAPSPTSSTANQVSAVPSIADLENNLANMKSLYSRSMVSREDVDEAQASLDAARSAAASGGAPHTEGAQGNDSGSVAQSSQRALDEANSNLVTTRVGLQTNSPEAMAAGSRKVFDTKGPRSESSIHPAEQLRNINQAPAVTALISHIPADAMKNDPVVKTSVDWYRRRESDKEETRAKLASVQSDIENHRGDPAVLTAEKTQLGTELKRADEDQQMARKAIENRLVNLGVSWIESPSEGNGNQKPHPPAGTNREKKP